MSWLDALVLTAYVIAALIAMGLVGELVLLMRRHRAHVAALAAAGPHRAPVWQEETDELAEFQHRCPCVRCRRARMVLHDGSALATDYLNDR
jgi:hypothetical protein